MPTTSSVVMPALPTSDLRSDSKAYLRDKNHSAKWARGGRSAPGKRCEHDSSLWGPNACNECVARPYPRDGGNDTKRYWARLEKHEIGIRSTRTKVNAHQIVLDDIVGARPNSDTGSSDDEVVEASAAPKPESDVIYSYDHQSGPSTGSDILSNAVVQAVKRFENKQTEQLVKNEYDLVLDGKEIEDAYAGDAEDEYEIIDHEDWN